MGTIHRFRQRLGALLYDVPGFEARIREEGVADKPEPWLTIRNRRESIESDTRGVRCDWRDTSELHIANVFPAAGIRLMNRALTRWPIELRDEPADPEGAPRVSFIIGHRGMDRLPHLLLTLRSIAGQSVVPLECVVIEQSQVPEIERALPAWVRYVHTPLPRVDLPYCRSWAFNVGARIASGSILVFHDNDMIMPAGYALEVEKRVQDGWMFVDLKRFIFYLDSEESRRLFEGGAVRCAAATTVVQNAQGGSVAATRDSFLAIGGFDEEFVGWGGEDNDFRERAMESGRVYDFGYLPFLHLHHPFQAGKSKGATPAVERYRTIASIPPAQRIARLVRQDQGRIDGPSSESR